MKVAILGAAGQIGTGLCYEAAKSHRVFAFVRPGADTSHLPKDIIIKSADLDQLDYAKVFRKYDWVIDAAAPYPTRLDTPASELNIAFNRYRCIAKAALDSNTKFSHIGSFITLPRKTTASDRLFRKGLQRTHPYYVLKFGIEKILLRARARGANIGIFCPSIIIGPWNRKPDSQNTLKRIARGDFPVVLDHVVNVIDVRDTARFIVSQRDCDIKEEAKTPVFGHFISMRSLVSQHYGRAPLTVSLPPVVVELAGMAAECSLDTISLKPSRLESLGVLLANESYKLAIKTESLSDHSLTQSLEYSF